MTDKLLDQYYKLRFELDLFYTNAPIRFRDADSWVFIK